MEEAEGLTDHNEEQIHHHAHTGPRWASWVALSTAILAAFAAVASLLSGKNANEAMIHQLRSSDQWGYYQAKGIKASVAETRSDIFIAANKPVDPALQQKLDHYRTDQEEIKKQADEFQKRSEEELHRHEIFARAVTLFQVSIAISAISVLTKRRLYWFVSLAFGMGGVAFFIGGCLG